MWLLQMKVENRDEANLFKVAHRKSLASLETM